jgi:hypothetical protein
LTKSTSRNSSGYDSASSKKPKKKVGRSGREESYIPQPRQRTRKDAALNKTDKFGKLGLARPLDHGVVQNLLKEEKK